MNDTSRIAIILTGPMEQEIWKDIKGYEGGYKVSNKGNVLSLNYRNTGKEKLIGIYKNRFDYKIVSLKMGGKQKSYRLAKLVAEAFVPNTNNYDCIRYKDGNKDNVCADNLEWASHNTISRIGGKIGGKKKAKKVKKDFIAQYDLDGNLVDVWNTIIEITKANTDYTGSNIRRCCLGITNSAYGYRWQYVA